MVNKNSIKLFVIAFVLNLVENIGLLIFYEVPITKNTIIGAGIFGLCVSLIYKIVSNEKNEK